MDFKEIEAAYDYFDEHDVWPALDGVGTTSMAWPEGGEGHYDTVYTGYVEGRDMIVASRLPSPEELQFLKDGFTGEEGEIWEGWRDANPFGTEDAMLAWIEGGYMDRFEMPVTDLAEMADDAEEFGGLESMSDEELEAAAGMWDAGEGFFGDDGSGSDFDDGHCEFADCTSSDLDENDELDW